MAHPAGDPTGKQAAARATARPATIAQAVRTCCRTTEAALALKPSTGRETAGGSQEHRNTGPASDGGGYVAERRSPDCPVIVRLISPQDCRRMYPATMSAGWPRSSMAGSCLSQCMDAPARKGLICPRVRIRSCRPPPIRPIHNTGVAGQGRMVRGHLPLLVFCRTACRAMAAAGPCSSCWHRHLHVAVVERSRGLLRPVQP